MKSKEERETVKATREKQHFTYRRAWFKESQISPEGNGTFFKSCQHTILCPVKKKSFGNEDEIRTFLGEKRIRDFTVTSSIVSGWEMTPRRKAGTSKMKEKLQKRHIPR